MLRLDVIVNDSYRIYGLIPAGELVDILPHRAITFERGPLVRDEAKLR